MMGRQRETRRQEPSIQNQLRAPTGPGLKYRAWGRYEGRQTIPEAHDGKQRERRGDKVEGTRPNEPSLKHI